MPGKLKQYNVKGTFADGHTETVTVSARSKDEARKAYERKFNYKAFGITVSQPFGLW